MPKVKRFDQFINEKYSDFFGTEFQRKERKTKFSNWLEDIRIRLKERNREISASTATDRNSAGRGSAGAKQLANLLIGGVSGAASKAVDFLFAKKDSSKPLTREERKQEIEKQFPGDVSQKEAEKFYRDSLLAGKDRFGPNFDLERPKNKEQRKYAEYVHETMERLFKKIK